MATKKQKRAAALAKREKFLENERLAGLKAQEIARQMAVARAKKAAMEANEINDRHRRILDAALFAHMLNDRTD